MSAITRTVSLKDVAVRANVSVSTASRALSNAGAISPDVRQRVRDAAGSLGYGRPPGPRGGTRLRTVRVFATLDTFSNDAAGFFADIIDGIAEALAVLGLAPEIVGLDSGKALPAAVAAHHAASPSDGLLLLAIDDPAVLDACRATGATSVLVNGTDPRMQVDSVAPANERGTFLATQHLIELGHRRIAHIGAGHRTTIADRARGYCRALGEAGLPSDPAAAIDLAHLLPDLGHAAMAHLLDQRGPGFTGIVCGNDLVAVGVLRALQERGMGVPDACSVIGFDDVTLAALASPRLTTMAVDRRGIGREAVRLLIDRAAAPAATPVAVQLGCRLVLRDTTGPAPRS